MYMQLTVESLLTTHLAKSAMFKAVTDDTMSWAWFLFRHVVTNVMILPIVLAANDSISTPPHLRDKDDA